MGTYSIIVNAVRDAATSVNPTGRFIHGRKVSVTQKYDGAYPIIVLYPFVTPRDNDDNDTSSILMAFLAQDSPPANDAEEEAIISAMDDLSDAFYFELLESKTIQINSFRKEPQYQIFAGTLSGYAISFNIVTKVEC